MTLKNAYVLIEGDKESKDVLIKIDPGKRFNKGFFIGMDDGYMLLAKMDLTASQFKVLLIMISQMEYQNLCYITQSFISKETGIPQPNVSKNINKMILKGLLFKENTNRGKAIRVNSVIAWKGKCDRDFKKQYSIDSGLLQMPELSNENKTVDIVQNL